MRNKPISCGVIVTNGKSILLGHSTGNKHWDIPKGSMDDDETFVETALRELDEETAIELTESNLLDLGYYRYTPRKDLYLFLYKTNNLPDLKDIHCKSLCQRGDRWIHELDSFKYVNIEEIDKYVTKNMNKVLQNLLTTIQ